METTIGKLLIFKTNVGELCTNCKVFKVLNNHAEIQQWSIDTEDVDCVLRVTTATLTSKQIITIINNLGHKCLELS